ncbi:hypothetical protein EOD39_6076 [Acipenser ruthenus]|uniref:Uncharacterized protein n=1 Tax=Acipenser ruthenus TaxID=7906 RepID=A0A444UBM0_ACIRT|nr:hypothetical protein EOD39_6076 [Acipenser ruthenus]
MVLGASAPQCLGLDACGTLRSSLVQSLCASVLQRPRCTKASTPWCLGALAVQALPDIGGFVPRCSIAAASRCVGILGASRPFEPCAAAPSVPRCPRASVPQCFDAL